MLPALAFLFVAGAQATQLLDRNLAYHSPFEDQPHLSHNTESIQKRFESAALARRQVAEAPPFKDEHYVTFYGGEFGNGDPLDTSVLLWTRAQAISPVGSTTLPDQSVPVCVSYKVYTTPDLSGKVVDSGSAFTSYDVDWTVKVDATGLKDDTKYYYQFSDCANPQSTSPVGSTRTLADPHISAERVNGGKPLTFAVFSCSQYQAGWFNAYGVAAHNTSADVFVHLGDYIYESIGSGGKFGRAVLGRELATIADYRLRLNQYRTDPNLVVAHQNAPWITVANNAWKAGTSNSNDTAAGCKFSPSGACFTDRKLAAIRAYHEWIPIRQVQPDDKLRIWRNFQIGKLIDLTMLDTRQYDRDLTDLGYNKDLEQFRDEEERSTMGAKQEQWFYDTLSASKKRNAVWRIVGQQIVFSQIDQKGSLSLDAWDGYRSNRARIFDHLYNNKISNTIILAGDSHANWVSDLARPNDTSYDALTGNGAIGVEFGGTAVTSTSSFGSGITPANADITSKVYVAANPELQWSEGSYRGFFTLTVDSKTLNATFYGMKNTSFVNLDSLQIANFVVKAGENKLSRPVAGGAVQAGIIKAALDATSTTAASSTSTSALSTVSVTSTVSGAATITSESTSPSAVTVI
ncbi:hypothetical protein DXG01_000291 [Tephrocybe rancida]|nr:hypothetical protein DXG01_000291 [Tephrocybe rancida]